LYNTGSKPSWQSLNAELNKIKSTAFPWMNELPWGIRNKALANLGSAFSHFFRRIQAGQTPGYPKFKSKKLAAMSFSVDSREVGIREHSVRIPKLGWVRTREPLRFPGKVISTQFTRNAGHWYVSIQVEVDESRWSYPRRCETQAAVGVDLGVRDLAVLSTGEKIEAPRVLRVREKQLRRLDKELSRRTKGGANWRKTKAKLGRLHERISNVRKDVTHNLTTSLVKRFRVIGIEDLNVVGMMKNRRLAKSVMDASMGEVGRQLGYKATLAGSEVVVADRWFPSSKICSDCGTKREGRLSLSIREWACESCGVVHDRDVNAAINLRTAALAGIACRQGSAGSGRKTETKLPLGQESSSVVDLG